MLSESCSLGRERKLGGTFHLRLNTNSSPIANKYREGKVQSTLERELNVPETAVMQAYGPCAWSRDWVYPVLVEVWRLCVALLVGAVVCLSSCDVCQHGFVRGQKPVAILPPGKILRGGLCADCQRGRELSLSVRAGKFVYPAGRLRIPKVLRAAGSLLCVGLQGVIRPVLKHGPRSPYTCASM